MKSPNAFSLAAIAVLFGAASLFADDVRTLSGREYKDVKVSRIEPDGITIITKNGVKKIPFAKLSGDVRERYGYDPQKEAAYKADEQQKAAAKARANAAVEASKQLIRGIVVKNTVQGVLLRCKLDSGRTVHESRWIGDKHVSGEFPVFEDAYCVIKQHPNADVLTPGTSITITAIPGGRDEIVDGRQADVYTFVCDNTPLR